MQAGMIPTYALTFFCWFLMVTILAVVSRHLGESVGATPLIGLILWFGFSTTRPRRRTNQNRSQHGS